MTKPPPPSRRRGGQLGNHNAVTHGFYAAQRLGQNRKPGEVDPADSLVEEIAMMRHMLEEITSRMPEPRTLEAELNLLNSVTITAGAVNRLLRAQSFLSEDELGPKLDKTAEGEEAPDPARTLNVDREIELLRESIAAVTQRQGEWERLENSGLLVRRLALANVQLAACMRTRKVIVEVLEEERKKREFKVKLKEVTAAIRLTMASARAKLDDAEEDE